MNDGNVKLWLYLTIRTGISKARLSSLYKHFKSSENIFAASKEALLSSKILSEEEAEKIICPDFSYVEEYMGILNINRVKLLTIESPDYPEMLLDISNPPLVLYCRGNYIDLNKALCIAFVGTRNPTPYGRRMTYSIARGLCQKGFVIVSGMAQGIDAVSHKAAIDMGCPTVAFIASGVDIIYPRINAELFRAILKNGMVVSEYPLGTMPKNYYFPERNRLVAGVSRGVFVSEAGEKSGTSITVSYGVSQGKDIFALPGNADSPMSEMPNKLIKDGAYLVTEATDISCHYEELYKDNLSYVSSFKKEGEIINLPPEENKADIKIPEGKTDEERVLNSLSSGGLSIDDISVLTKIKLEELNMMLLFLEMNGKIKSDNGIYYLL
ncbi:MAG: DNA-processing protein DprA [Clostridia bacterium]|nr:DNA-processing protein DprA [Clostridia bacterium]